MLQNKNTTKSLFIYVQWNTGLVRMMGGETKILQNWKLDCEIHMVMNMKTHNTHVLYVLNYFMQLPCTVANWCGCHTSERDNIHVTNTTPYKICDPHKHVQDCTGEKKVFKKHLVYFIFESIFLWNMECTKDDVSPLSKQISQEVYMTQTMDNTSMFYPSSSVLCEKWKGFGGNKIHEKLIYTKLSNGMHT
jgi:hypothetical protein